MNQSQVPTQNFKNPQEAFKFLHEIGNWSPPKITFGPNEEPLLPEDDWKYSFREERNRLLRLSDWAVLPDSPLNETEKLNWKKYRQELRDLPTLVTSPINIKWPSKPI